jgi:lipopolysaccharide exporter
MMLAFARRPKLDRQGPDPADEHRYQSTVPRPELAAAGYRGVRWLGVGRVATQLAALGSTIVLARLIPPADFGYFAVVAVLFMLAGDVIGNGITATLVQRQRLTHAHIESAAFLALWSGVISVLAVFALVPLADQIFGSETAELFLLASPYFLVVAAGAVSRALMQRELSFARLGVIEAIGILAAIVASIALAVAGLDAEALVLGTLAGQTLATALFLVAAPSPRPRRHPAELRDLTGFGGPNALAAAAAVGARNVDFAVLAARVPAATVGFYWRGYQLAVSLTRQLVGIIGELALPLYSRAESPDHRRFLRSRIVRLHTLLIVPLLALLILLAPLLVPAVFGARWEPAVLPTQILAAIGMINTAQGGLGPMIVAVGHPRALLTWNLVNIGSVGTAVYIAAPHGLGPVCLAVLGVRLVRYVAAYVFLLNRLAGVPIREMWLDPMPAVVASAFMFAAVGGLQGLVLESIPPIAEVVAALALAPLAYVVVLRVLFPHALTDLLRALRRLLGREPGARVADGLAEPAAVRAE